MDDNNVRQWATLPLYRIDINYRALKRLIFLKAGEAKMLIDSHHAQVTTHYIYTGDTIESSNDIETAIHNITETKVANLQPNHNQAEIKSLYEWIWPDQGEDAEFVCAKILSGIEEWEK
ncbi:hypothetical protein C1645_819078 [Glomus cerebriforme]|uniref:Uncharacterized protein n=1 Tax=Glomus cerebriforme TaxID=658196 RepID=A0A397T5R2_9GLOM|nr:hypothetical protein C1645_819078 [Glomus cerebriforme]